MSFLKFLKRKKTSQIGSEEGSHEDGLARIEEKTATLEVKVMPKKFLNSRFGHVSDKQKEELVKPHTFNLKKTIIIGSLIVLVVGGLLALTAFLFINSLPPDVSVQTQSENAAVTASQPEPQNQQVETECLRCDLNICSNGCQFDEHGCWLQPFCQAVENPVTTTTETSLDGSSSSVDTDGDGLTDAEETVFGTDIQLSDSDLDGFPDGAELVSLYDPNFGGGARLRDSNKVRSFADLDFNYLLLIPNAWTVEQPFDTGDQVRFVTDTGEFFTLIVELNSLSYPDAFAWYSSEYPTIDAGLLKPLRSESLAGLLSPDSMAAFFLTTDYIYTLSYNAGLRQEINFGATFKMMIESFSLFTNPLLAD